MNKREETGKEVWFVGAFVIAFFAMIISMSYMAIGVVLRPYEIQLEMEETRQGVVTLNNPVGEEDEMDYVVGTVNSKHKGTDSDTGEESYYLTIDGKVYEVESNIYYSFNKNSDIKYKQ